MGQFGRMFEELKRRRVFRVAAVYAVVAWVTVQVASVVLPRLGLPEWTVTLVIVLVGLGFPLALVLAWAFEMTPEGVRRTSPEEAVVEGSGATTSEARGARSRLAAMLLVGLGLVAGAVAGVWYLTAGGGGTEPPGGERTIAVLPFVNLSGTEDAQPFVNGIHDDLLTRLSNVSGLRVVSRTSVLPYRETDLSLPAVAESLGVRWIVEGGVQQAGGRVQVNAQLVEAREDVHRWARTYRRELTPENLFEVQSELTKEIARSLRATLSPGEEERVEGRPTRDLQAFRLYVQGRSWLDRRTEEGMRKAVDYFRRAIRRDSTYALAWAGLADARGLFPLYASGTPGDSVPGQEEAARRALELDPDLAEAHASLGYVLYQDRQGPAALAELERAVELQPSYAQAHHWLGLLLFELGRLEQAREHVSLAVELNREHAAARAVLLRIQVAGGEIARAEETLRRWEALTGREMPDTEALVLYHAGRWEELERRAREAVDEAPGLAGQWRYFLARAAVRRGDTATALGQLAEVRRAEPSEVLSLAEGGLHVALGRPDSAFSAWRKVRDAQLWAGAAVPIRYFFPDALAAFREDPRWGDVIGKVNRAWGLEPDGSLPSGDGSP